MGWKGEQEENLSVADILARRINLVNPDCNCAWDIEAERLGKKSNTRMDQSINDMVENIVGFLDLLVPIVEKAKGGDLKARKQLKEIDGLSADLSKIVVPSRS